MCAGSDNQGNIVQYTFGTLVDGTIDEVEERVVSALADEGFGILTRIDLAATLKAKLDIDRSPYVILGACNPQLAHSMVEVDEEIGALLPCNVVLRQEGDSVAVRFLDPDGMVSMVDDEAALPIAAEAKARLSRACEALG